jgi:type IV pilus assembly protein PilB
MKTDEMKLKDLLVRPGYIGAEDFEKAVKRAKEEVLDIWGVLVEEDLIKDDQLGQLVAQDAGSQFVNLRNEKIDEEIFHLIPEMVASSRMVIAFGRGNTGIKLAMADPKDFEMKHILKKRFGENIEIYYATSADIERALLNYKSSIKDELSGLVKDFYDESTPKEDKDRSIIKIVDLLLQYGYNSKSSDIHIEPRANDVDVRFRMDGVLYNIIDLPKDFLEPVLSRVKILAKMRTDEHRGAQDGKFKYRSAGEAFDVRVSVVPVSDGENLVMRVLTQKSSQMSLASLGIPPVSFEKINRAAKLPQGMILVVGPTGSGKTTTIYEILKILNKPEVNIATIEDPVEYSVEGISQIQVNPKTNLTFAQGLRAIVRQDPDIIMVGEIRDNETAEIAINSAMTGHLVLSTLHANDAATTLPRLLDMGIEPFLVSSTVNIVIAQRLVRKVCEKCRYSYELKEDIETIDKIEGLREKFEEISGKKMKKIRLYKGSGCKICNDSGYSGRIGIYEVLEIDDIIKDLIIKKSFSDEIKEAAVRSGMETMLYDGITKALNGITTVMEVIRVTR